MGALVSGLNTLDRVQRLDPVDRICRFGSVGRICRVVRLRRVRWIVLFGGVASLSRVGFVRPLVEGSQARARSRRPPICLGPGVVRFEVQPDPAKLGKLMEGSGSYLDPASRWYGYIYLLGSCRSEYEEMAWFVSPSGGGLTCRELYRPVTEPDPKLLCDDAIPIAESSERDAGD